MDTLASNVSDLLAQQQSLQADIAESQARLESIEATNNRSAEERDQAVAAVEQVREALENLAGVEASKIEDIRRLLNDVRLQSEAADLSGVYEALRGRVEEQRATRQRLEAELAALEGDIEHLRRVNQALPNIPPGCNRGN